MNNTIFLRLFAEADSEKTASEIRQVLIESIGTFSSVEDSAVQRYWKIPNYYEIFLKLAPANGVEEDFLKIRNKLGRGWEQQGEFECIWNPNETNFFSIKKVKWAHLERV